METEVFQPIDDKQKSEVSITEEQVKPGFPEVPVVLSPGGVEKKACPLCAKVVKAGGWKNHIRLKHPDEYAIYSGEGMGDVKQGLPEGLKKDLKEPLVRPDRKKIKTYNYSQIAQIHCRVIDKKGKTHNILVSEEQFLMMFQQSNSLLQNLDNDYAQIVALSDTELQVWVPELYMYLLKNHPEVLNYFAGDHTFLVTTILIFYPRFNQIIDMREMKEKQKKAQKEYDERGSDGSN